MKPKRILIFELNWMGDILFSYPLLRAIREANPDAYITCVVVKRYADLLVHNPWINSVHVLSDDNRLSSIGEKLAFVRMIGKETYDTCILLKPSGTKGYMAFFAGISERIGFSGKRSFLTKIIDVPKDNMHRADQILALAGALGIDEADGSYEYFFIEEDNERASEILRKAGGGTLSTVAINPGGNWDAKRWPVEKFIDLSRKILEEFENVEIMVTGAKKDVQLAENIVEKVASKRCYSVAGKTNLNELAVLFRQCALVVSADSGPMHLASATGATTISLFGPTSHKLTGPRGKGENIVIQKDVNCQIPCYVDECKLEYDCMGKISVDEVYEAVKKVLKV